MNKKIILPLVLLIKIYQIFISPFKTPSCRYFPSCSHYAIEALQKHGFWKGGWFAFKRILSCHPWSSYGYNPVPEKKKIY